jgi:choline monooxygenase
MTDHETSLSAGVAQRWGDPLPRWPEGSGPGSFPASNYTDPARLEREIDMIFRCEWLMVGHGGEIPKPGDYLVWEGLDESVVIARLDDGSVNGFFNVCQHRGTRLTPESGHCDGLLTCPFHGLAYDLRGELRAVPYREEFDESQLSDMDLVPVATREWNGLLWINLAGDQAGSLENALDVFVDDLVPWNMNDMVFNGRVDRIVNCNWKVLIDGFLEAYHVPIVHQQSIGDEIVIHRAWYHHFDRNSSYYLPLKPTYDEFAESQDHVRYGQCHHFVFPGSIINGSIGQLQAYTTIPIDVDTCKFIAVHMIQPGLSPEGKERMDKRWARYCAVVDEDMHLAEQLAPTRRSQAYTTNRTNRQEVRLLHFHDVVSSIID